MNRGHHATLPPAHRHALRAALSLLLAMALFISAGHANEYSEAPSLRERVEAGELPEVSERLPEAGDIKVVEPVEQIGQYGGTMRLVHAGLATLNMLFYDTAVRWNRDYTDYIPGVFRDWEFNEDGTSITFYLRRGMRWSDGEPFTTDDLRFWYEDLAANEDFGARSVPWWMFQAGEQASFEILDDYSFRLDYPEPNWNVPYVLASGFWNWEPLVTPRHYLEPMHPRYNDDLDEDDYSELEQNLDWFQTPGMPTLHAWMNVEYTPGERVAYERNPYYWKVDTEGNQLPYIDRIESTEITDEEVRILRMIGGEVDLAARELGSPRNIPVLLDNMERGNYRWLEGWAFGTGGWPMVLVNQDYVDDEYVRSVLRDSNFLRGLSLAVDREQINDAIWLGLGTTQQATISPESWHFDSPEGQEVFEEWSSWYTDFDPNRANEYLDAAGLSERNSEGYRLREDNGEVFEVMIDIGDFGGADINQEGAALLQNHFEAVGLRVVLNDAPSTVINERWDEGKFMLLMGQKAEMDIWTFPDWIFPTGDNRRAFPLQSRYINTGGAEGEEPGDIVNRLYELYLEGLAIPDVGDRHEIVWDAIRIHMEEGPFYIGTVADLPTPAFASNDLRNVPDFAILGPWAVGGPGNTNPEQYYLDR